MSKARSIYEAVHGKQFEREVHHILPRHAGGLDNIENLISLSREEHALAHLELFKKFNNRRDIWAYYFLIGQTDEARRIRASLGGKAGGKAQFEKKLGIHSLSREEMLVNASKGGKKGGFTKSEIQRENGRRGGPKNKGFIWVTNHKIDVKYTSKMQKEKPVKEFLEENPEFEIGRLFKEKPSYVWVTNEKQNKKIYNDVDSFLSQNIGWRLGVKDQENKTIGRYNDGNRTYLYKTNQVKVKSFEKFLNENPQFTRGDAPKKNHKPFIRLNDGKTNLSFFITEEQSLEEFLQENPQYTRGMVKK